MVFPPNLEGLPRIKQLKNMGGSTHSVILLYSSFHSSMPTRLLVYLWHVIMHSVVWKVYMLICAMPPQSRGNVFLPFHISHNALLVQITAQGSMALVAILCGNSRRWTFSWMTVRDTLKPSLKGQPSAGQYSPHPSFMDYNHIWTVMDRALVSG